MVILLGTLQQTLLDTSWYQYYGTGKSNQTSGDF